MIFYPSKLKWICCALALAVACWQNHSEKYRQFIAQPLPGDLYKIREDQTYFTLYKVRAARADTVFLLMNAYSVQKLSELRGLDQPENFEDLDFSMTKSQLDSMLADGQIIGIARRE